MVLNRNQINETQAIVQVPQSTPTPPAGRTGLYPKTVSGVGELFFLDDLGQEIQLTNNGAINVIGGGATISDDVFGVGWDSDTTQGASRNALYDKLTTMDSAISTNTSKVSADGSISTHSDITLGTPAIGHILRRDATNSFYESVPNPFLESASNLSDVANAATALQNLSGVSDGLNVGSGTGNVFKQKNGTINEFRKILAGTNVTVLQSGDDIQISATGGGSGESNTASNLGTGAQLFTTKSGVDLPFRSIIGGSGLSQTQNANDVTLDMDVNSLTVEGAPDGANDFLLLYDASSGTHKKIAPDNLPGGSGEANTASNIGTGAQLFTTKSGVDLPFRSLIGGEGLAQTQNANDVTIDMDINGLSAEAAIDGATDFIIVYDASVAAHRKVLIDNLPSSVGGAHGEMYTTGTTTTSVTAGVYTKLLGTYSLGEASNFDEPVEGRLRYTGGPTQVFHVHASISASSQSSSRTYSFRIAKNGTPILDTQMDRAYSNAADPGSITLHGLISLDQNDYVEVFADVNTGTNNLDVEHFTLTAVPMGGSGSGENNTSSSVGAGAQLTKAKSGVDLPFRSLIGGEGLTQTQNTDDVTLDLDINALVADASPIGSTDYVAIYDASAGSHKKVLLDDLPGGGGGGALTIQEESANVDTAVTNIDFHGVGITATQVSAGNVKIHTCDYKITLPAGADIDARVAAASPGDIPSGWSIVDGLDPSVDAQLSGSADDLIIIPSGDCTPALPAETSVFATRAFPVKISRIDSTAPSGGQVESNTAKTQFKITKFGGDVADLDSVEIFIKLI